MQRKNSKELILDAAEAVVLESGAGHMSLDVVAKKARVSKGGLLYHFPSKEKLLKAMVSRLIEAFYFQREKKLAGLQASKGRLLKAEIMAALDPDEKRDRMALSILAAAAQSPNLLDPLKEAHSDHLRQMMDSGLPFERAAMVSLASDGLMFLDLLHLSPFSPAQRVQIRKELISFIEFMESEK